MFRNSKPSDISPKNFGAGSIIEAAPGENWLVVSTGYRRVRLVDLRTFELLDVSIEVADPNYLCEDEARQLANEINSGYTFSDFECKPKGLKEMNFSDRTGGVFVRS